MIILGSLESGSGLPNSVNLNVFLLAVTANIGSKSAISCQRGCFYSKFQVEGVAHQPFFFSEN